MAQYYDPATRPWAEAELREITDDWSRAAMKLTVGETMVYKEFTYSLIEPYHPGEPNPVAPYIEDRVPTYITHDDCYYMEKDLFEHHHGFK